ncbi:MAG: low molecular weight protein-tyrosine-phosphatase [Chitinophagaceae bacterium]
MKILMVCLGNICRSPLAEGILLNQVKLMELPWQVDSAGTEIYHIGEPPHIFSQKVALAHGIDISSQRARRFTPSDFDRYDLIYAMATNVFEEIHQLGGKQARMEKVHLMMNELFPGTDQSIPDPYSGGEEEFFSVFQLLEHCCQKILDHYAPIMTSEQKNFGIG